VALNEQEKAIIAWYRTLSAYQKMLLTGWLLTGDAHLLKALGGSVFSSELHQFLKVATPERR
jgi:hypothetical protein